MNGMLGWCLHMGPLELVLELCYEYGWTDYCVLMKAQKKQMVRFRVLQELKQIAHMYIMKLFTQ